MGNATKTPVKKTPATSKTAKPVAAKAVAQIKSEKAPKISADLFDVTGKVTGKLVLPEEIFGVAINTPLMAQAVRIYLANQREGAASTKTRSTVSGSTRKIYRQKGTGRARHGAAKAPIFVHGGIAHGPHPRDYALTLPQKMRQRALVSALSSRLKDGEIRFVDGTSAIEPKTKIMAALLKTMAGDKKHMKKTLIILSDSTSPVAKAVRNVKNVVYTDVKTLTTYDVLKTPTVIMVKEAVEAMKTLMKGETK